MRGAGSVPMYDGHNLATEGAVLVTIDYRLDSLPVLDIPLIETRMTTPSLEATTSFWLSADEI